MHTPTTAQIDARTNLQVIAAELARAFRAKRPDEVPRLVGDLAVARVAKALARDGRIRLNDEQRARIAELVEAVPR